MRKNRREWDESRHVRALHQVYRVPTEEVMTLTQEQFEASTECLSFHRTTSAVYTNTGLVVTSNVF